MIRSLINKLKPKHPSINAESETPELPPPREEWFFQIERLLTAGGSYELAAGICREKLQAAPEEWPRAKDFGFRLAEGSLWRESELFLSLACSYVSSFEVLLKRGEVLEKIYYSFITELSAIPTLEMGFDCWRNALRLDPTCLSLRMRLAAMLMVTGQTGKAGEAFNEYVVQRNQGRDARQLNELGFHTISSIPNGIGHITLLDYYVKMRELGIVTANDVFILLGTQDRVNRAFLDYWKRWGLKIISHPETVKMFEPFIEYTEQHINVFAEIDNRISLVYHAIAEVERRWHEQGKSHLLELSDDHRNHGWETLSHWGIKPEDWFVTFHVRESGYTGEGDQPPNNHRNSKVETYFQAVRRVTEAGGWVVRLGDSSMTPLPKMERVIDYAHSEFKSDWMDLFLCAENRFYLGTSSGPCMIPPCFGKKCALANYELLSGRPFYFGNIYLPKLLYDTNRQQLMTFREILEADTAYCFHSNFFTAAGRSFIHNTPEEIDDMVAEMMASVEGSLEYSAEEERMQRQFNDLGLSLNATYGTNSRISRDFLKKHENLLGD